MYVDQFYGSYGKDLTLVFGGDNFPYNLTHWPNHVNLSKMSYVIPEYHAMSVPHLNQARSKISFEELVLSNLTAL